LLKCHPLTTFSIQLTKVIKGYAALVVLAKDGVRTWEQVLQKLVNNPFERASHAKDVSYDDESGAFSECLLSL